MSDTLHTTTSVAPTSTSKNQPEPFLQWVGGKRKIASQLIERIPTNLNNYYEPFLGGGALFFAVKGMFSKYFLSDINLELVTSYNAVKKDPAKVNDLFEAHRKNHCREYYYKVRSSSDSNDPNLISARFLYLNRYSFKGIYRINKNGSLDVSFADRNYKAINFGSNLQRCSSFLNIGSVMISAGDFSFIDPQKNDFVYFDPPYHNVGEEFYTRLAFDEHDQTRLSTFARELDTKSAKVMISNSDTQFIRNLYKGFNINTIDIKYLITGQQKTTNELVITNF